MPESEFEPSPRYLTLLNLPISVGIVPETPRLNMTSSVIVSSSPS